MMEEKRHEIWHTGEYFYVKLESEGLQPSTHEIWLRPYFRLEPDFVVMDIGAHVGSHTLWLATQVVDVIACEPHPYHRQLLSWNLALNNIHNVSVLPFGLMDGQGTASMPNAGGGSKIGDPGPNIVAFTTIDLAFAHLKRLDFVKIDCESAEAKVLRGGRETLKRLKPHMIIESHHVYEPTPESRESMRLKTEREISACGYRFKALTFTEYPYAYYYDCWAE